MVLTYLVGYKSKKKDKTPIICMHVGKSHIKKANSPHHSKGYGEFALLVHYLVQFQICSSTRIHSSIQIRSSIRVSNNASIVVVSV